MFRYLNREGLIALHQEFAYEFGDRLFLGIRVANNADVVTRKYQDFALLLGDGLWGDRHVCC